MESALSDTAVEVDGLRKAFGTVLALDGLSFRVPAGSITGLLGPNGSGKTTTVSILSTALRPDSGQALVAGLDVTIHPAEVRRLIGRLSRLPRPLARDRADEALERFGLAGAAGRLVRGYSGGMRRRLDVAA